MMAVIWSAMLSFTTAPIFKKLNRLTGFRYPNHIRVTLQEVAVMEGFVRALRAIL